MGPLFSLRPRAPVLSQPPGGGVGKRRGAEPGPTSLPCLSASWRWWGSGVLSDAADTLRPASVAVPSWAALPAMGEGRPSAASRAPSWARERVSPGRLWCSWGAPGCLSRCPRPSWCGRFPFLTGTRCRTAGAVGESSQGVGGGGRHACSPRVEGAGCPVVVPPRGGARLRVWAFAPGPGRRWPAAG